MEEHTIAAPPEDAPESPRGEQVSFFTLDPRKIGRSRLVRALAIGLLIVSIGVKPVWRLGWYLPVYSASVFAPSRDTRGRIGFAWRWVDGHALRVYAAPGVDPARAETVRAGAQAMVDEIGLDFTVTVQPMPPAVEQAYRASLVQRKDGTQISYNRLAARLIALRDGDPHADLLVVNTPMTECTWAHGMASFTKGVGVFEEQCVDFHLGKHETGHLLGYHFHDSLPLFVIGYPWEGLPNNRETLMMLLSTSTDLSPRAKDALTQFWHGMEDRAGTRYFNKVQMRPIGTP